MKHRTTIAAIATAVALGGSCAFLVPAASAKTVTRTLTFTSVLQSQVLFSQTTGALSDRDVNKAGKVIGYDLIRFAVNPKAHTETSSVAVVLSGGLVYAVTAASGSGVNHGQVTGGTGIFKGATGTVLAKNLNAAGTKTAVTITYHT